MPTFCVIICRNRPSEEDCKTLQDFTGRTTQIIFPLSSGLPLIRDRLVRKLHECEFIMCMHTKYQFANVECDVKEEDFYKIASHRTISGTITNIRNITAQEIFELTFSIPQRYDPQSAYEDIPGSLLTYKFVKWLNKKHPEIETQPAKIMTGKQFNKLFPGPKTTLIDHKYITENSPKMGLNVCAGFSPAADPNYFHINRNNGLYCVEINELRSWADYLHMDLCASAEIPENATVVIMHTQNGHKYKSSHMIVGKFQTISE